MITYSPRIDKMFLVSYFCEMGTSYHGACLTQTINKKCYIFIGMVFIIVGIDATMCKKENV